MANRRETAIPPGKYVVAGASGLVGTHMLMRLADEPGVVVRGLYNHHKPAVQASNISIRQVDLTDSEQALTAMEGADYVFLFAGFLAPAPVVTQDPVAPAQANLRIISGGLEAAWKAGVKKLVWLSSTTVYPDRDGAISEDMASEGDPPGHWYALGWAMRCLEALSKGYATSPVRAMPCAILRPSLIYGEHDHFTGDQAHFLPAMINRVVAREQPIEVWGDGEQRRDLIHAADVVEAALLAFETVDDFDIFNVGAGETYSVNEILQILIDIDAFVDAKISHLDGKPTTGARRSISINKAKSCLGFQPQVSIEDGLRRTLEWYRKSSEGVSQT